MTRSAWFWSQVAVVLITAALAFSVGWQMPRWIAASAPEAVGAGPVASERPPAPPALRCIEAVEFDARNTPIYTARPWSRTEAETQYHQAKQYLATAEAAGLWNDVGQRAARLATAQLLEILVCWPGGP